MCGSCSLRALLPQPLLLLLLMAATGPTRALTEDEKRAMVELHNSYRAQVSPPASDMLQMRWDAELAAFAKAYAQKCVWGHNKERGRRGENLFAITDEGMDVPLAMENWHQEREHYNLSTATCAQGQMCGHYTQVIWSKTERIGCGSHFCEKLQGVEETNIQLLVCNYEPPGNVKGKRPYQEGTPCSQCPPGYSCENSLCEPPRGSEEAQESPKGVTEVPSTQATEASGSRETGTTSLATEVPHFSVVTEVSGSPATEAPPAVETKAPSSLATAGPSATTEVPPSLTAKVLSISATHKQLSLDEGPNSFPTSTHVPAPKSTDKDTSKTSVTSMSPERFLYPEMSLTGTGESSPQTQEEAEAEAVLPAQEKRGGLQAQATLDHSGHPASKSLSNFPSASASANATGGRTLALQASCPAAEGSEKPGWKLQSSAHAWGPLEGLLLLPTLLLARVF